MGEDFEPPNTCKPAFVRIDGHVAADADKVADGPGDIIGEFVLQNKSARLVAKEKRAMTRAERRASQVERHGARHVFG